MLRMILITASLRPVTRQSAASLTEWLRCPSRVREVAVQPTHASDSTTDSLAVTASLAQWLRCPSRVREVAVQPTHAPDSTTDSLAVTASLAQWLRCPSRVREVAVQPTHAPDSTTDSLAVTASLAQWPESGIMEADHRQVTTDFTVQPSFHHRHSTNRVSWSVTIVGKRAVTPWAPRRPLTMVTLHDTRFVECRWWNDG